MNPNEGINRELTIGEVLSKTFELYQRNFAKYFTLFLIIEAVIGTASALAYATFALPTLPTGATTQQILDWMPGYFGALFSILAIIVVVSLVLSPIAEGSTLKMASEEIETGKAELGGAVRFAVSKLISMWALGILVGIIVVLGLIALIIPGIILAIMFCMALPALLLENTGVIGSLGRSRVLVGQRWLKTFALGLILVIIVGVISVIISLISAPFGAFSSVVTSLLSAFYQPIIPVALTVYFYSNRARISAPKVDVPMMPTAPGIPGSTKYCSNCGTQMPSAAIYCPKCGLRQVP